MATTMHRLQISLPHWQAEYLADRARREGVSRAELIRRLVERAAGGQRSADASAIWNIVGIAEDAHVLIDDVPVSEQPRRYLAEDRLARRDRHSE